MSRIYYATVTWTADDVKNRVKGMTKKEAEEFMVRHERLLQDALIERGNELIGDLIGADGLEPSDDF